MSSRKQPQNAAVDASLRRAFSRWAQAQQPPLRAREALLRRAKDELTARQHNPLGFSYSMDYGLGPVANFNQSLGLQFSLHARVRF